MTKEQKLSEHLGELKNRFLASLIIFIICFGICYYLAEIIYAFLTQPLEQAITESFPNGHSKRMIFTSLTEGFFTHMRLAFISALFFSFPFIACQFYLFLAPALYKKEKKFILIILLSAPILFFLGAFLLYDFILPLAFKFFIGFETFSNTESLAIEIEPKIDQYLGLVTNLVFAFGLAFQTPIILVALVKFNFLKLETLKNKRKYWIVLFFIIAAAITPPDVISQIALALPMILLFEIAILIANKISQNTK